MTFLVSRAVSRKLPNEVTLDFAPTFLWTLSTPRLSLTCGFTQETSRENLVSLKFVIWCGVLAFAERLVGIALLVLVVGAAGIQWAMKDLRVEAIPRAAPGASWHHGRGGDCP
jgi:hypothetical protein